MNAKTEYQKTLRDLESLPIKFNVTKIQLSRDMAAVQGEISQISGDLAWTIIAPTDGTVSAVTIVKGQSASAGSTLMSITPRNSALIVKLYAPSKSLGFIKIGSLVRMKVDAFPFQKFGFVTGHVEIISDAPTPTADFVNGAMLAPKGLQQGVDQEPLFEVVVALDENFLMAYGNKEKLRTGLQIEGDIQLENRRIFEWMLEPIMAGIVR